MNTKWIGLATSDLLNGSWKRPDKPLLLLGEEGFWEDLLTTNPSFIKRPNGEFWLYYKFLNTKEYNSGEGRVRENRRYGLAIAKQLEGPYEKYKGNLVGDFSGLGNNKQFEDAYVWFEGNKIKMTGRDLGIFGMDYGLYLESEVGILWSDPEIAYQPLRKYVDQPPAPKHLNRYDRAERPQLLFQNGNPTYMFTASRGGKYETASSFIFKIKQS